MKPLNEKVKHILIDIVVVFVIPGALFYLYTTIGAPAGVLFGVAQPGSELVGEGQKFLAKLNELQALTLDTSVFESAVYKSLIDSTVPPPTEDKGRTHPFVPPTRAVTPAPASAKTNTGAAVKNLNSLIQGK